MANSIGRRRFLQAASSGALFGLGDFGFMRHVPRVSAAELRLAPGVVQLNAEIEPLVRLIEETPREDLIERIVQRIRGGASYREVLAALFLAGVRNVEPRPSVGFKFHSVLVVNSAHLASMASPDSERWLPILWALDYFKSAQARDVREGNWTMAPVDESRVPSASEARRVFTDAMQRWDVEAADVAVAGLARTAGSQELFETFAGFGARDFRSIGHKAIFVASAWRTLQCIGWQHSEPVLRSLAYALLNSEGQSNPAESDHPADRPWRENQSRVAEFRGDWLDGRADDGATAEMMETLRSATPDEACRHAIELINGGLAPQSVWDALLDGSGELMMRKPGIVALHAVTTTNAVRYAFESVGDPRTRQLLLLQNVAFVPMFRQAAIGRSGSLADLALDALEPLAPDSEGHEAVAEVFSDASNDRMAASRKALALLDSGTPAEEIIGAARRLVFAKGNDAHDYKFSSAVLEDFYHVSPKWRNRYLASAMFHLPGSGDRDNRLIDRARAALTA